MTTKLCPVCGDEFGANLKPYLLKQQRYCSADCRSVGSRVRVQVPCAECGALISAQPARLRTRKRMFCTKACKNAAHSRDVSGHKNPAYKAGAGLQTFNCKWCGKEVKTYPSRVKVSKFCSSDCWAAYASKHLNGVNSPSYRGGKVKYHGRNWKHQSRLALQRDGYRCQICGKNLRRGRYEYGVHHIKPYREFEGDYEQANELLNLITLCRPCHARVEAGKLPCPQPLL